MPSISTGSTGKSRVYIVVSPVRDEESHIGRLIDCMASQTVEPAEWIIVDDGSTDATCGVVEACTAEYPWIRLVRLPARANRQRGAMVVKAFYAGLGAIRSSDWDFLVKLDADLSFGDDYFETLLDEFERDPRLGIAGGTLYIPSRSGWRLDKAPLDRVWGPTKMYRRACFEEIGGLVPHLGWDAIDDFKAQLLGWQTETLRELVVHHHRAVGTRSGVFRAGVEHGRGNYFIGSHPLFVLVRATYRMFYDRPLIVSGVGLLCGYFADLVLRRRRVPDPELIEYVRRKELSRLTLGVWQKT